MVLNGENRLRPVAESFTGLVVEIDLGGFGFSRGQGLGIDRKAMVLGGYADPARGQVFHGLICAAMPELELEGLSPQRISKDLMSETNPEDRFLPMSDRTVLWA